MPTRPKSRTKSRTKKSKLPRAPSTTARKINLPYPRDENGKPLCRWCRGPVVPPRKAWCGDACVTEYRERYDSAYQRRMVLKRDRGICAGCGLDCVGLAREVLALYRGSGELAAQDRLVEAGQRAADLRFKGWRKDRLRPLWDADHTVPVIEGGGGARVSALRTLCRECHRRVTRELMARRRAAKKATPVRAG